MPPIHWSVILFSAFAAAAAIQVFYYLFFFRRISWYQPKERGNSQQHPVSVIVCARDEDENLAKFLPGILVQKYPTSYQVITVNDNSLDDSKYILEELGKTFKNLHVVELKQEAKLISGKKYPLSIGIREARHEILLLTDADCVPASENWIHRMQDAYEDGIEIVLGYGAYHKKKGMLNKLIRFETFHTALQYLSYSLAGTPYMGVGRNLSYKKDLFLRNKGFSSINHIPSGDDDLFINRVATSTNTAVVIDPDAMTYSLPETTWSGWLKQKRRHYSTSRFYKRKHKYLLGLYFTTQFLYYPLLAASLIFFDWRIVAAVALLRLVIQGIVLSKAMKKMGEPDLRGWFLVLDIWMFFYYIIFVPALWKKPSKRWN
ncbi:MAG: glycosyltransferase [Chitinophagaceae bacterium]|nr:MAG: glycosyltransferase [Chitinophagaceae bacterium]